MTEMINILILDDNKIDLFINNELIKHSNINANIREFAISSEVLEVLKNTDLKDWPHMILLDIHMPVMNGFDFLNEFANLPKEKVSKCKIVILSYTLNPHDRDLAQNNPFVIELLEKPLNTDELYRILVQHGIYKINN